MKKRTAFLLILPVIGALLALRVCALARPGKGTVARTIKVGALSRTYYLHVPGNLPKDKTVSLVLMFHGGGGTPAFAERESKFSELADREGFIAVYPEGIGKSWNDGRNDKGVVAQRDNIDDLGFIAALVDDVAEEHKVERKRVFATGISNGAIFSHYLAANLSSRIAAIAAVVGGLAESFSEKFKPEHPVAVLVFQGIDDPLVPYKGGEITVFGKKHGKIIATDETVMKWTEHNGCQRVPTQEDLADKSPEDGCRVTKFTYAQGRDGTEVVLYRIVGGGHTWPHGLQYLPEKIVGRVCRDFDGTSVIWEFFKAHPKP